jgi:hypothetical protein
MKNQDSQTGHCSCVHGWLMTEISVLVDYGNVGQASVDKLNGF